MVLGGTTLGSLCSCSSPDQTLDGPVKTHTQALVAPAKKLTLTIPPQAVSGRAALIATQTISIADRVKLDDSYGGWASVSALNGTLSVGANAKVGSLWAGGDVTLRSYALVTGDVTTAGAILPPQAGAYVTVTNIRSHPSLRSLRSRLPSSFRLKRTAISRFPTTRRASFRPDATDRPLSEPVH